MRIYNVALIGCGQMGKVHLEHIYFKNQVNVACVCDSDAERAKEFMCRYNAKSMETDAEKCISREDVDVVIIATYPSSHLELLKVCIKNKKHVICEKPITDNIEDGREFVRIVKENPDVKVLIGHLLRHNATYKKVAQMIHDGAIGKPIIMRISHNQHTMCWERYKKLIEETAPIIDCGVHYVDIMHWFTKSKVEAVSGIGMRTDDDVPEGKNNYEMLTARFEDGSVGFYEAGWTRAISSSNTKEFVGPLGSIKIIYQKDRIAHIEEGDLIEYYCLADKSYHSINVESNRQPTDAQFDHLVKMIEEDVPAIPSIDEVLASFEVALRAEASISDALK